MMCFDYRTQFLKLVKAEILPDDIVCSDIPLSPHFAFRKKIFILPEIPQDADWIIADIRWLNNTQKGL